MEYEIRLFAALQFPIFDQLKEETGMFIQINFPNLDTEQAIIAKFGLFEISPTDRLTKYRYLLKDDIIYRECSNGLDHKCELILDRKIIKKGSDYIVPKGNLHTQLSSSYKIRAKDGSLIDVEKYHSDVQRFLDRGKVENEKTD